MPRSKIPEVEFLGSYTEWRVNAAGTDYPEMTLYQTLPRSYHPVKDVIPFIRFAYDHYAEIYGQLRSIVNQGRNNVGDRILDFVSRLSGISPKFTRSAINDDSKDCDDVLRIAQYDPLSFVLWVLWGEMTTQSRVDACRLRKMYSPNKCAAVWQVQYTEDALLMGFRLYGSDHRPIPLYDIPIGPVEELEAMLNFAREMKQLF